MSGETTNRAGKHPFKYFPNTSNVIPVSHVCEVGITRGYHGGFGRVMDYSSFSEANEKIICFLFCCGVWGVSHDVIFNKVSVVDISEPSDTDR